MILAIKIDRKTTKLPVSLHFLTLGLQLDAIPEGQMYPFRFRWTKRHEDFCVAENIFLKHALLTRGIHKTRNMLLLQKGTKLKITCDVWVENFSTMPEKSFCSMGAFSYAVDPLPSEMNIGRYCSLAKGLTIMATQHPLDRITTHPITYIPEFAQRAGLDNCEWFEENLPRPVIGNDVWIGANVLLKGGITIGDGAVIGAHSVVTKNVPPYAVVAGTPAQIKRFRFPDDVIAKLLALKWWDYQCKNFPMHEKNIEKFIDEFEKKISLGDIVPHAYKKINLSEVFRSL